MTPSPDPEPRTQDPDDENGNCQYGDSTASNYCMPPNTPAFPKALLLSLRDRGLDPARMAIGNGTLGFWAALLEVYLETGEQHCWVHKNVNVLDKLPKRLQGPAKSALYEVWQAANRAASEQAFNHFVATYQDKYPKALDCLAGDRAVLLAFYDFPAAHWQHIHTTNLIESTFATIRLRTRKTRNCVSARTGLSLIHQLAISGKPPDSLTPYTRFDCSWRSNYCRR